MNMMQVHFGADKPGLDEANHFFVPFNPMKLIHGVLKINVRCVYAVGLVKGESLIVVFEDFNDVHSGERHFDFFDQLRLVV
jgi:hypothetical protein